MTEADQEVQYIIDWFERLFRTYDKEMKIEVLTRVGTYLFEGYKELSNEKN
jgi:hypothetical protein